MGGDSVSSSRSSSDDESSVALGFQRELMKCSDSSGEVEGLGQLDNDMAFNGDSRLSSSGELPDSGPRKDSKVEAIGRQRCKVYAEVLRSYEDVKSRIERFEEAKRKALSYTPGSWVEKVDGNRTEYDVPKTTLLLLIGPKGSGKSSLVNKISQVLENGVFSSGRAQVTCNQSAEGGTYFVHQYVIPRDSGSFCLYDTRGLSDDICENLKMLKPWMTKGVRHGKLVKRESDSEDLKARLKCKARGNCFFRQARTINFVIFVVNGLSVLESMDGANDITGQYSQLVATIFDNPLLSFKDDKPVVVVTHGDLMSVTECVRVRVYLGELLGVPPTSQIFDIPERENDLGASSAIVDMLIYCLEHADRNLPAKNCLIMPKIYTYSFRMCCLLLLMVVAIYIVFQRYPGFSIHQPLGSVSSSGIEDFGWHKVGHEVDWLKIRHIW